MTLNAKNCRRHGGTLRTATNRCCRVLKNLGIRFHRLSEVRFARPLSVFRGGSRHAKINGWPEVLGLQCPKGTEPGDQEAIWEIPVNWNRRTALTTNGIPYAWIWISLAALGIVQAAFFNSLRKFRRKLSMSEDAVLTMVYILALKLVETMALTTQ